MDDHHPEIIIVKRRSNHEEEHHGGAWKIAFARFHDGDDGVLPRALDHQCDRSEDEGRMIARYFNPVEVWKSP